MIGSKLMKRVTIDDYSKFKKILLHKNLKNKNLYISGASGIGKTEFAKFVKGYSITTLELSVKCINKQDYISKIQDSWSNNNISKPLINFMADVFITDDLGAERFHDSTISFLYEIFEKRFDVY